jgi:hypothetical protein
MAKKYGVYRDKLFDGFLKTGTPKIIFEYNLNFIMTKVHFID